MSTGPPTVATDLRALVEEPTGIGVYTLSLLEQLAARGGARYLGLAHAPLSEEDRLRGAGIALELQPAPLGVWWQQLRLPRRLAQGDVDLFWSPLLTLPLRLPVPGVVTVHDLTPVLYPHHHRLKVRLSVLPFLGRSLEIARRVVAVSRATADDLRFHFPACADRIEVVYNGVDDRFAPAGADQIATIREELGCPEGYLLYVGTLEPRKNLQLLLDVWEALRIEDESTPPLVLAGAYGWGSARLLRRIRQLEALGLRYLGRAPDERLPRLFQGARLFVYPSLYEGFGLPPAEAMACGVPTLVSDRSSLPEVVGDAGILFAPDEPESLAQAIRRVLASPGLAAELGERGRERASAFRWDEAARQMEGIFFEALTG